LQKDTKFHNPKLSQQPHHAPPWNNQTFPHFTRFYHPLHPHTKLTPVNSPSLNNLPLLSKVTAILQKLEIATSTSTTSITQYTEEAKALHLCRFQPKAIPVQGNLLQGNPNAPLDWPLSQQQIIQTTPITLL
jgi:hypothetical protein